MKLTKENVYVDLRGKTKEELTDLWEFLTSNGEKLHRDLDGFLTYSQHYKPVSHLSFNICNDEFSWNNNKLNDKTEVTIEELKQILQPIDTLEQQLQKAEAEVKRLQSLIEEENKPKVGDWVCRKDNCIWKIREEYDINTHLLKDCKKNNQPRTN